MALDNSNKDKTLQQAFARIEHQFGRGSIMRLGTIGTFTGAGVISTGSISLDAALGIGGIPRGRVSEIFGPEASGNTTLALHIIAEAQKTGGIAAFIDAEHALDPIYARNVGVDIESLLISQPDTGEQALEIVEVLVRSGALDTIAIDSVAALVPKAELDGDMGDAPMGLQAQLMSQGLRKLTAVISKSRTSVIFINQLRHKIGVSYGNPETTTGGNALKFYSSVRLDIRRINALKRDNDIVGSRNRVRVIKNKLAPPFHQAEFDVVYGKGISRLGELVDLSTAQGLISQKGSWFSYQEMCIGQGRDNAVDFLEKSPDVTIALDKQIRYNLGLLSNPTNGTALP